MYCVAWELIQIYINVLLLVVEHTPGILLEGVLHSVLVLSESPCMAVMDGRAAV